MSEPARFDTIGTDRLLMRRWLASDREPFAALNADPETMLFFPETLDRAASDTLADRIEARFDQLGYGLWALEISATGEFIGFTGLKPMPDDVPGAGGAEVGWRLTKNAWHSPSSPRHRVAKGMKTSSPCRARAADASAAASVEGSPTDHPFGTAPRATFQPADHAQIGGYGSSAGSRVGHRA